MVNQIFEVNRITFTDDELPLEGSGHNRALHLIVKCEEHYVKRVMVDGGSGVDICPLSTLQSLKINTDRIRTNNVYVRAFDGEKWDTLGENILNCYNCTSGVWNHYPSYRYGHVLQSTFG